MSYFCNNKIALINWSFSIIVPVTQNKHDVSRSRNHFLSDRYKSLPAISCLKFSDKDARDGSKN